MDVDPRGAGFDPGRLRRIDEHLRRAYLDPGKIPGCQVLVARRGRIAHHAVMGALDLERGRALPADAIFRIYSMSKPVASVALMTLFEEGAFQLDDPVHRVLPAWRGQSVWVSGEGSSMVTRPPARPVSFRDVLSHTGGLTYGSALAAVGGPAGLHPVDAAYAAEGVGRGPGETLESFADKLGRTPLRSEPGTRWQYSYSSDVLGRLVEVISGRPFDVFLRERIFEPLGMADTGFFVPDAKVDRFAANYRRTADKRLERIDDPYESAFRRDPSFKGGGGGLVGTAADYGRFCEMLRGGGRLGDVRILSARTLALMTRNHLPGGADLADVAVEGFTETAYAGVGFGLGFAMTLDAVRAGVVGAGDYYWGGAASTIFWVDPVEDLWVVFMTQLMPSGTFNFRGQLKSIVYGALED